MSKNVKKEVAQEVSNTPLQRPVETVSVEVLRELQTRNSGIVAYLEGKVEENKKESIKLAGEIYNIREVIGAFFSKLSAVMDINGVGELNGTDYELLVEVDPKTNQVKLSKKVL